MADRELGRVGAWPQVLGHLELLLALHHLVEERQTGDEADHRHEPWRIGMGGDEFLGSSKLLTRAAYSRSVLLGS